MEDYPKQNNATKKTIISKTIIFMEMEDNLTFFENGRRPQKSNAT
jgi:hypothetical protein